MKSGSQTLSIGEKVVPFRLIRRKRHNTFTLSVHAGGSVTLTVPKRTSSRQVQLFLRLKKRWLIEQVDKSSDTKGLSEINRKEYESQKEKARQYICTRLKELNEAYGFVYHRVSIRANKTRWGSCSQNRNLNFDYRVLFLPESLRDYVLVHELCHLQEMNHSPRFWKLVEKTLPAYRKHRKDLRNHVF